MAEQDARSVAKMMIERHRLRAQAVAEARIEEMRLAGDAEGLDHWQQVHAAIRELRRTAPRHGGAPAAGSARTDARAGL